MIKYLRCEYWDFSKGGITANRNIQITGERDYTWHEIFNAIEKVYFRGTQNYLIGFMNFKNISSWEHFNNMSDDDIQEWIDKGNVEFYWCRPEIFSIPKGVYIYQC